MKTQERNVSSELRNPKIEDYLYKQICPICQLKITNKYSVYGQYLCPTRDFAFYEDLLDFSFQLSKKGLLAKDVQGFTILVKEKKIIFRKKWLAQSPEYFTQENIILSLDFSDQEHSLNDLFLICKKLAILE